MRWGAWIDLAQDRDSCAGTCKRSNGFFLAKETRSVVNRLVIETDVNKVYTQLCL